MKGITIRTPTPTDALTLAVLLREADDDECQRAGFEDGAEAIMDSMERSDVCYVALNGEVPLAIWGLVLGPCLSFIGCPWLLTSSEIEQHKLSFLKVSRRVISQFSERCPGGLFVQIDLDYCKALKWAEWLGFELLTPEPHPATGELFVPAIYRRK